MQYTPQLNIPYVEPTDLVTDWPSASEDIATAVEAAVLQALAQTQIAPVASVQAYAGATAPTGWLLCDGTEYNQADYTALFGVIGQTYGGAVGKFKVPNLTSRVIIGPGGGRSLSNTGGAETHTLTTSEIPAHTHTYSTSKGPDSLAGSDFGAYDVATYGANGSLTTNSTGGGAAHNNMQPYIVLNYVIKT